MLETLQNLNYILAVGGIVSLVCTAILVFDMHTKKDLLPLVKKWGLWIALISISLSTVITLVYSEYFGLIPCGLCWLERVALYPQVFLLLVALYYNDMLVPRYGIALSSFGFIVSMYHHYLQMGGSEFIKCPASGAECAKRFLFEFNFVTFPLLSAMLFGFLIVIYLYILKTNRA